MGTNGDDSSALTEFTPLWKTRVSNYPLELKNKGRDTRCDKSRRHIAATSRIVCTAAATSRCGKTLVLSTQANLEEGKCELVSKFNMVDLNFVAATCRTFGHTMRFDATRLLALILSQRSVARIQTSLNSCDRSQRQKSVAATMIFTCHTMRSVAATCRGDVVAAICRIVCLGLKNISLYLQATRPKQLLSALTIVNVQTLSNQNSLVSSKTFLRTRSDDAWPLIEFTPCEKQKYQVTFVTKDSKHLVGTSADDLSALIEFTPLWKTRVSNYPFSVTKKQKYLAIFACNKTNWKQSLSALSIVNVQTL